MPNSSIGTRRRKSKTVAKRSWKGVKQRKQMVREGDLNDVPVMQIEYFSEGYSGCPTPLMNHDCYCVELSGHRSGPDC